MDAEGVRRLLSLLLEAEGLSQSKFAKSIYLAPCSVNKAINGRVEPHRRILRALGLRRVKKITYEPE